MNEERFTGKAVLYKKFRPSYPKEFIDYLYSQVGFSLNSVIADIGSGTGIFSRLLLERDSSVYCVEPNDDMRRTAEEDLEEFEKSQTFISVNASAHNTGLPDKSIDFVTAAQAFHWFDRQLFKLECQRILKPGGKVVIVWNERDYECEIVKKDYAIREKYAIDKKGLGEAGGPQKAHIDDFFRENVYESKIFKNDLHYTRESWIGRNLSASYAPKEETEPDKYHGFVFDLGELFDEYNINGILNFPNLTQSYVGGV